MKYRIIVDMQVTEIKTVITDQKTQCIHCGDECIGEHPIRGDKYFCCHGCLHVYSIIHQQELSDYYDLTTFPGLSQRGKKQVDFSYLDDEVLADTLITSKVGNVSRITFEIPQIHCISCVYVLENLHKFQPGVRSTKVNFARRQAQVTFDHHVTSLRSVVECLDKIGYAPTINYNQLNDRTKVNQYDKQLIYKIGLSGFCFGNIMLLSFPEYLGLDRDMQFRFISYLHVLLALPVFLYAAKDFLIAARCNIINRKIGVDLPIALGICALFFRSLIDIMFAWGEGYMDSFTGFVFFLLIGRWFQQKTYKHLSFDRDYSSYFPIAVLKKVDGDWRSTRCDHLEIGDHILIKNYEIIPADGILLKGKAYLDYSFVTGESDPTTVENGALVYAGGRHKGSAIVVEVRKKINKSYLTQLWDESVFYHSNETETDAWIEKLGTYFTISIITIGFISLFYWLAIDPRKAFESFTAVLIVACPCVLALAVPFLYGNALRLLAKSNFYARSVGTITKLQNINTIIFDKTGTLTNSNILTPNFNGAELSRAEKTAIKSVCFQSNHPLSQAIYKHLPGELSKVEIFQSIPGFGIEGLCGSHFVRIGSTEFILDTANTQRETVVCIEINHHYMGHFSFNAPCRDGTAEMIERLQSKYELGVISGDTNDQKTWVEKLMPVGSLIAFDQKPVDKLEHIKRLQEQGANVLMIGDGLNDAGALKQSDLGAVITDHPSNFAPACDMIIDGANWKQIPALLLYSQWLKKGLWLVFILAITYNSIALGFAVTGLLSPVVAAILMPLSSVSMIFLGIGVSSIAFRMVFSKVATDKNQ